MKRTRGVIDKERMAAWVAIRCAASVGEAQRARLLLIGDSSVTSRPLREQDRADIPEFVMLDLLSSYVFGEKKRVFKSKKLVCNDQQDAIPTIELVWDKK